VIAKAVPPEMLGSIASKPSARAAWESLILRNVGVDRVRKAKASTLRREFDSLLFHDGESLDDFGAWIGRITNQLAILGFEYREEEIVRRFLQALPPKFEQIAASIETLLDMETLTVDKLIGRLKPTEERANRSSGNTVASLNLTEDELVAWLSSRLKLSGNGGGDRAKDPSSSSGKRGRGRGKGHGTNSGGRGGGRGGGDSGDRGGSNVGRGGGSRNGDVARDECRYCGHKGHWIRKCKKKWRDEEAHAAQVDEEEESTLLVASDTITELVSTREKSVVHLDEGKLFVQLGDKEHGDCSRWILDSGAMNHMTGERSAFIEIDHKVHGTVRFGDGAVANIEGQGTILLKCKTGEHKALVGIYLIPRLTANIVSLGQLEEDGHKIVLHEGFLKIWDRLGRMVAKVQRAANRLYVLRLDIDRPVCLAAQGDSPAWR
jgi:hypothetical protein